MTNIGDQTRRWVAVALALSGVFYTLPETVNWADPKLYAGLIPVIVAAYFNPSNFFNGNPRVQLNLVELTVWGGEVVGSNPTARTNQEGRGDANHGR